MVRDTRSFSSSNSRISRMPSSFHSAGSSRRTIVEVPSEVVLDGYSDAVLLAAAVVLLCMLCCTCSAVRYCCTEGDSPLHIGSQPDKKSGASSVETTTEVSSSPALPQEEETAVDRALVELKLHRPHFTQKGLSSDDDIVSASNADLAALGLSKTQEPHL